MTSEQYAALGYEFYVNTSEGEGNAVYIYSPGGFGKNESFARLRGETAESLEAAGLTVTEITNEEINSQGLSSLPGMGDVEQTLEQLETYTQQIADYVASEMAVTEGDTITINGVDYSRDDLAGIVGEKVAYSEEQAQATAAANTAAADAAEAEKYGTSSTTVTSTTDTHYNIVKQNDGTYAVIGNNTGTVYASEIVDLATATDKIVEIQKAGTSYEIPEDTITESVPIQLKGGTTKVVQQEDGTWAIVSTDGTTTYASGFPTTADALAVEQALVGGFSEGITKDMLAEIDTSGLTAEQVASLEAIAVAAEELAGTDITDEAITDWLTKAAETNSEYYAQLFTQAGTTFTAGLEYLTSNRLAEIEQEQENLKTSLEAAAVSAADVGLTSSGIRAEAERRLEEEAADIATSSAREYEYAVQTAGREAEYLLGSEYVEALELPTSESGEEIYSTTGDIYGSLQTQQDVETAALAQQLEDEAAEAELAALEAEEPEEET